MRAHMHSAHGRRARATAGRARTCCCCCCCCCCCRWHAPPATAAAAAPTPPGGPQPPGATSESRGGSNPVVPSFVRRRAHTTSEHARSPLPGMWQTIRSSLSAPRRGDAQRAAKHGHQAKGSSTTRFARQRNMRQRAPIRLRGRRRHKGACGGGERDWDGVFCDCPASPAPWGTPRRSAASAATRTRRSSAENCRRRPSSAYQRLQKVNLRQEVRDAGRKGREGNGAGGTAPVSTIRPIKNRSNRRRRSRSVWGS